MLGPTFVNGAAPSGPTLLNSGQFAAPDCTSGTHYFATTSVFPNGESPLGGHNSFNVSTGNPSIAPAGNAGQLSANVYMTKAGASSAGPYYRVSGMSNTPTGAVIPGNNIPFPRTQSWYVRSPDASLVVPFTPPVVGYPYGGIPVGIVSRAKIVREQVYHFANSEARGRDGVSGYGGRFKAALVCVLVQYDPTILNKLYAVSAVSANGFQGANILGLPQPALSIQPGVIAQGTTLLLAADDPTFPSTMIYAPIFTLGPKVELDRVLNKPYETGLVVVVGLDSTNRDMAEDLVQNLAA